jgi:prepilin-type processing-associated H-X9-DG protein/prepilin-type N-terminal cleavage/methylation domain-containing protein
MDASWLRCGAAAHGALRSRGRLLHRRASLPGAGFTVLELLVALAVMAVLMAIVLPALSAAREAARRVQCTNHLKQIGLALHCYEDSFRCFPAGWQWEDSRQSAYGWAVPLLPYVEQRAVYELTDRTRPVTDPVNAEARTTTLDLMLCPSDIAAPRFELYEEPSPLILAAGTIPVTNSPLVDLPTANYVGVFGTPEADDSIPAPPGDGAFIESRPVRLAEFRRGLSQTLIVGERTMARVPSTWLGVDFRGADAACRLVGNAATRPNCAECDECEFDSRHAGGVNFLWGDGHVEFVAQGIDTREYRRLSQRSEEF